MEALKKNMPVIYLSHGSPDSGFIEDETSAFWKRLGEKVKKLDGIKALLLISAHWEEQPIRVNKTAAPQTIYDFYGFPSEYYSYEYPGKGSPELGDKVLKLLASHGIEAAGDTKHGLDHGSWVPLKWMLPDGNIPVVQLSLLDGGSMEEHVSMGKALRPLREEGVLIVGSGTAVHNLRDWRLRRQSSDWVADYVAPFDLHLESILAGRGGEAERIKQLINLEQHPLLHKAHPTIEHLLPVHVAVGAAGPDVGQKLYHKHEMSFSAASFVFGNGLA